MSKDNSKLLAKLKQVPTDPGVYIMKDQSDSIIYIGKAKSLKKRLASYFQKKDHDAKTSVLVSLIENFEFIITDSEIEALILEYNLIKKHKPKFNIRLKDDKRYPYIAITLNENYPRVIYTRWLKKNGDKFFGPYTDAKSARNTVELINNIFSLKTCTKKLPLKKGERPCLNYQMKKCSGICQNKITMDEYQALVKNAMSFLEGNIDPVLQDLEKQMSDYSKNMKFERAADMRDMIFSIQKVSEKQKMSIPVTYDQDYIALSEEENEAILILFEFRKGILLGRKIFNFQNTEYTDKKKILESFIIDYYTKNEIPNFIITAYEITDKDIVASHLTELSGKKITINQARGGDQRAVINLIQKNIDIIFAERAAEKISANKTIGITELQKVLSLKKPPLRMECFDISNFQGANSVASMASFYNGVPDKSSYRKFKIRYHEGPNDPAMIHEAVSRRLQFLLNENLKMPDLLIIDGGITQISRAMEAAATLGAEVKIISIAKREEEIYTSPDSPPIKLKKDSPGLKIIQNIRDETHRFGITYHRLLRDNDTLKSVLDEIKGIGEKKRNTLLAKYKSIENIKNATVEDLKETKGISSKEAEDIFVFFRSNEI